MKSVTAVIDVEPEHPNFTVYNMADPEFQIDFLFSRSAAKIPGLYPKLACVEAGIALAEEEQVVDEASETAHGRPCIPMAEPDAQACGRLPEMAPAPCEHACPHGVFRRQEREEMVEGVVRERADAIAASIRRRRTVHLSPFPQKHSCQQNGEKERKAYSG